MSRKAAQETKQFTCVRDGMEWGEYIRKGDTYSVVPEMHQRRGVKVITSYHFRNEATGGGSMMQPWAFARAIKNGWIVEGTAQ